MCFATQSVLGVRKSTTPFSTTTNTTGNNISSIRKVIAPTNNIDSNNTNKRNIELEDEAEVFRVDNFGKAIDDIRRVAQPPSGTADPDRVNTVAFYEASKNTPRVMRRIHLMPINTTYHGGFESGQPPAGVACSRGVEILYRGFIKPPLAAQDGHVTTSPEGVRLKAPEPFDELSVRGYYNTDSYSLRKFAHHHHYDYEGLMSRNYYVRKRGVQVSEGELKDRFPFVCQSDRGTYPPKRDGTMQPLALVEMGILSENVTG